MMKNQLDWEVKKKFDEFINSIEWFKLFELEFVKNHKVCSNIVTFMIQSKLLLLKIAFNFDYAHLMILN